MSNEGSYKVLMKRGEFVDEARYNEDGSVRTVPFKLYYPSGEGIEKAPVIFWSHGYGGSRDGASFISRHLASLGYVLVHLTHYGTDSSLWEGKPGHPWDVLRKLKISRETTINRFYDVPFAFDQMISWAQENPDVGAIMDFERVGMSGHSFGAMTTQVMAGMKFPNAQQELFEIREPRFSAGILYSPVPIGHLTDVEPGQLYGGIDIPLLHMTGTDDASPLEDYGYEHRLIIRDNVPRDDQYVQVLENGDHMVYNGTRGKLVQNPYRERHEAEIIEAVTHFWNAHLKDDPFAMDWVKQNLVS